MLIATIIETYKIQSAPILLGVSFHDPQTHVLFF